MENKKTNNTKTTINNLPHAIARYIRISPYKAKFVLDLIRGKRAIDAINILQNTNKRISKVVEKVVCSAIANAEHNNNLNKNNLIIKICKADKGPTLKRMRPVSRGRGHAILKRTCHITVVLDVI